MSSGRSAASGKKSSTRKPAARRSRSVRAAAASRVAKRANVVPARSARRSPNENPLPPTASISSLEDADGVARRLGRHHGERRAHEEVLRPVVAAAERGPGQRRGTPPVPLVQDLALETLESNRAWANRRPRDTQLPRLEREPLSNPLNLL